MWDIPFLDRTVSVLWMQEVTPVWDNADRLLQCHDVVAYETYGAEVLKQVAQWELHPMLVVGFELLNDDEEPVHAFLLRLNPPHGLVARFEDIQRGHSGTFLKQPRLQALYGLLCEELEAPAFKAVVQTMYEKATRVRTQLMKDWHAKRSAAPKNLTLPVANQSQPALEDMQTTRPT